MRARWYHLLAVLGLFWSAPAHAVLQCALMGDADYTVTSTDTCVLIGSAFTAPRTIHLPHAGATQLGQGAQPIRYADGLTIIDIRSAVTIANTLTIAPYPGDAIHGSPSTITSAGSYTIVYPLSGSDWWLTAHGTEGPVGPAGGDLTGTYPNPTLAVVLATPGVFGSATSCITTTVNAKGQTTAISAATCTPAIGSITGLAAGIATFLGTPTSANLRAAVTDETGTGLLYFQGGALGTPASTTRTRSIGLQNSAASASQFTGAVTTSFPPSLGVSNIASMELGDGTHANTFITQSYMGLTFTCHF